jgi:hypothetical protein
VLVLSVAATTKDKRADQSANASNETNKADKFCYWLFTSTIDRQIKCGLWKVIESAI